MNHFRLGIRQELSHTCNALQPSKVILRAIPTGKNRRLHFGPDVLTVDEEK